MGRVITSPGVLKNVQGQIDHVTDMYDDIKDNNLKPLTVTLDPVTNANGSYSHTTEDERITEDMKAVTLEVGTPECFRAPVTVSTANGSATVQCTDAHGNSTITVTFVKTSPVIGGVDYPPAVTSTEFDILADRIGALTDLDTTDKSSIVNAVNELESDKAPNSHASASTTYGVGNASNYGHVKLSDTYNGDPSNTAKAANSIGASQWAVQSAYGALNNKIGTVPSGQTVEGQITSLNDQIANIQGTELTASDLNDVVNPGYYYVTSNSVAASILHRPDGVSGGFGLRVLRVGGEHRKMQIYFPNEVDALYIRHVDQETTSWVRVPSL